MLKKTQKIIQIYDGSQKQELKFQYVLVTKWTFLWIPVFISHKHVSID